MSESIHARAPFLVEAIGEGIVPAQASYTAGQLAELALELTGGQACVICGIDRLRGELRLLAARGLDPAAACACRNANDAGIAAALAGQVSNTGDLSALASGERCDAGTPSQFASRLSVPLGNGAGVVGVVQVYGAAADRFSQETVTTLTAQSKMGALALDNARLYDRAGVLFALANTLSTTLELQAIGDFIAEQVARAMDAKGCSLRVLDRLTRRLDVIGSYGLSRKYLLDKGPVTAGENIGDVLAGKPAVIRDVATDSRIQYPAAAMEEGIRSLATVPMVVKGVVTGVLRVYTGHPSDFTAEDVAFLSAAAGVAGAAVENARLYDGIRQDFEVLVDEIVYMRRAARAVGGSKEARV